MSEPVRVETRHGAQHARDRERIINAGIIAGKFPESRRAHYEDRYDRNPTQTTDLILRLASGLPQKQQTEAAAQQDDAYPPAWVPPENTPGEIVRETI